jgi:hypothetical protein
MVAWIRENKPAKLEGLWKSVLPEGSTAPPADYAADLFWLLHQGHILLYTDDTLAVQEPRESGNAEPTGEPKKAKKKKKSKKVKPVAEGAPAAKDDEAPAQPANEAETPEATAVDESVAEPAVEDVSMPVEVLPEVPVDSIEQSAPQNQE